MSKHLFLDLENTLVAPVNNGWESFELINIDKIRKAIDIFSADTISIFSFALWTKNDVDLFNQRARTTIEQTLGRGLTNVFSVHDILLKCAATVGKCPSTFNASEINREISPVIGKQEAFKLFCKSSYNSAAQVLLIDDTVFDEKFIWPQFNFSGIIYKIDSDIAILSLLCANNELK
jgi:hypothetical protein